MSSSGPIRRAMLMAAGLGTRLRPVTELIPKALVPVLGVPMAQFALDQLAQAGVQEVVVNVHHRAQEAIKGFRCLDLHGMALIFSDESELLLGSAGGLRKALPHFGKEPFYLVNADVICNVDFRDLARRHGHLRAQNGALLTLAVFRAPPDDSKYREIFLDPACRWIRKLGELQVGRPFFAGVAVLEPEAIGGLRERVPLELVPEVFVPAVANKKAGAFLTQGYWRDVGSPYLWWKTQLDLLHQIEDGSIPPLLKKRVESFNYRVNKGQWVSKRTVPFLKEVEMKGCCYWDRAETLDGTEAFLMGPNSILYNVPREKNPLKNGIGFERLWLPQREPGDG